MFVKKSFPRPFFYLLAVFSILFLIGLTGISRPFRQLEEKILIIPLREKIFRWQKTLKKDLNADSLKNESNLNLSELQVKNAALLEENQELRQLLSVPLPKNWQFLPVKVIGVEGEILIIDAGGKDGLVRGMIAVSGGSYIGRVDDVSESIGRIKMASFLEEKLSVKIVDKETNQINGRALAIGRGLDRINLEQILSSEFPQKSDLVMVSLSGGDLLVGEVNEVTQTKGEPFKTATVKTLFDPENLSTIFLVRGKL